MISLQCNVGFRYVLGVVQFCMALRYICVASVVFHGSALPNLQDEID